MKWFFDLKPPELEAYCREHDMPRYVADPETFYCPAGKYKNSRGIGANWGWTYTSDFIWYANSWWPNSPRTMQKGRPTQLLIGDMACDAGGWTNHPDGGEIAGANWCYLDGHAEWKPAGELNEVINKLGILYRYPRTW